MAKGTGVSRLAQRTIGASSHSKQFSVIQIEYHYGYYELKQQLHKLGFAVNTTKPRFRINKFAKNHNMYVGWLYAQRT